MAGEWGANLIDFSVLVVLLVEALAAASCSLGRLPFL